MNINNRKAAIESRNRLPRKKFTKQEIEKLPEYSLTMPTGKKEGFVWKRNLLVQDNEPPVWVVAEIGKPLEQDGRMVNGVHWWNPTMPHTRKCTIIVCRNNIKVVRNIEGSTSRYSAASGEKTIYAKIEVLSKQQVNELLESIGVGANAPTEIRHNAIWYLTKQDNDIAIIDRIGIEGFCEPLDLVRFKKITFAQYQQKKIIAQTPIGEQDAVEYIKESDISDITLLIKENRTLRDVGVLVNCIRAIADHHSITHTYSTKEGFAFDKINGAKRLIDTIQKLREQ